MPRHGIRREIVATWRWLLQWWPPWRRGVWRVRWSARHFIMSSRHTLRFDDYGYVLTGRYKGHHVGIDMASGKDRTFTISASTPPETDSDHA